MARGSLHQIQAGDGEGWKVRKNKMTELQKCVHVNEPIAQLVEPGKKPASFDMLKVNDLICFGQILCALEAEPNSEKCKPEAEPQWGQLVCESCNWPTQLGYWDPTTREKKHKSYLPPVETCSGPMKFVKWQE